MPSFTTLLVGAHFRPPAKQVLARLAAGTPLQLEIDNENAYDPEAIRVTVDPREIPESQFSELDPELNQVGITLEQLMSAGPIWLGFIPASGGKPLAKARQAEPGLIGNHEVREMMASADGTLLNDPTLYSVELAFALDGSPRATITTNSEV